MTLKLQSRKTENAIKLILIILSGTSATLFFFGPMNIVPYAIYGYFAIIPSAVAIFAIGIYFRNKLPNITKRLFWGMAAGAIATVALEAVRLPGYMVIRWMPMDSMISLPGLLLTQAASTIGEAQKLIMQSGVPMNLYYAPIDAFMAGALWHFWNGATFGIIYALVVGKGRWWYGIIWGVIIEIGMMLAPYLIVMAGPFGIEYKDGYNMFVMTLIAHIAFGAVLGLLVTKFIKKSPSKSTSEIKDEHTEIDT